MAQRIDVRVGATRESGRRLVLGKAFAEAFLIPGYPVAHRVGNPNLGPPTRPPLSTTATCQQEKTENWTDKHWPPTRTLGVRVGARQSRFQTGENYDAKYSRNVWNNADGRKGCCQRKRHGNLVTTRYGSPARIRTSIHGSKGRCPTIRRVLSIIV